LETEKETLRKERAIQNPLLHFQKKNQIISKAKNTPFI
jgi:hypothetical protein